MVNASGNAEDALRHHNTIWNVIGLSTTMALCDRGGLGFIFLNIYFVGGND